MSFAPDSPEWKSLVLMCTSRSIPIPTITVLETDGKFVTWNLSIDKSVYHGRAYDRGTAEKQAVQMALQLLDLEKGRETVSLDE